MPNTDLEITQKAMEGFKKIQEYLLCSVHPMLETKQNASVFRFL